MNRILKFVAAPILVLLLASVATAQSYSPVFCSPIVIGARFTDFATAIINGSFFNFSPFPISVFCPIVKNGTSESTSLNFALVIAFSPTGASITCSIHSLNGGGGTIGQPTTASGVGQGNQTLTFSSLPPGSGGPFGSYHILCTLPSGAAIRSYSVGENP